MPKRTKTTTKKRTAPSNGPQLKERRKNLGLTALQAAQILGLSSAQLVYNRERIGVSEKEAQKIDEAYTKYGQSNSAPSTSNDSAETIPSEQTDIRPFCEAVAKLNRTISKEDFDRLHTKVFIYLNAQGDEPTPKRIEGLLRLLP